MPYVDAFVLAVPRKNLARYKKVARFAGKLSKECGALEYRECVGDDLVPFGTPFDKLLKLKNPARTSERAGKSGAGGGRGGEGDRGGGDVLVFSWVVYKSKAARDAANKKLMADPRLNEMCGPGAGKKAPFDMKRMSMAGCKVVVDM